MIFTSGREVGVVVGLLNGPEAFVGVLDLRPWERRLHSEYLVVGMVFGTLVASHSSDAGNYT